MRVLRTILIMLTVIKLITHDVLGAQAESTQLTSLNSTHITSLETLPSGIVAAEFDGRPWNNPHNGLFLSRDLGTSWVEWGFDERGITDLEYANNHLYVCTYYKLDGTLGLFIDSVHSGPNVSCSNIAIVQDTLILGTYSHGLWVSNDHGITWEQKLGDGTGVTGPTIVLIESGENVILAHTPTNTYLSIDKGLSWAIVDYLAGKQISAIHFFQNMIYLGTSNYDGLYKSTDSGLSWEAVSMFENKNISNIYSFKDRLYVQANEISYLKQGDTWEEVEGAVPGKISAVATLFSYPSYFFKSVQSVGVFKESIQPLPQQIYSFLNIPWNASSSAELIDKITSYFDHEFPLGNYQYHQETPTVNSTTLNYLGHRESPPLIYYSGHNGTDFALPYGTEVIAPADGVATYFFCNECGHSIRIDHQNGYESTYLHLQFDDLITLSKPVQVYAGDKIGKIGLSGNSSGPHLHFSVQNGEYPDGMVDPFGWKNLYNIDPWGLYTWQDISGFHRGTNSNYLWNIPNEEISQYVFNNSQIMFNHKTITINLNDTGDPLTIIAAEYIRPTIPVSQIELDYVEGTSLTIMAVDHYENVRTNLDAVVTISVDLTELNLQSVVKDTLKVYFWDPVERKWKALTTLYDAVSNKLTANTRHLSHFAVLGDKVHPELPETHIEVVNNAIFQDSWYFSFPEVEIVTNDLNGVGIDKIFYSFNSGLTWLEYESPFLITTEGITTIYFRALDLAHNLENTKTHTFKIDTKKKWKDRAALQQAGFSL